MIFEWPKVLSRLGFYSDWRDNDINSMLDFAVEHRVGWIEFDFLNINWFPDRIKKKTIIAINKQIKKHKLKIAFRLPSDLDFLCLHHNIHQAVMSRTIEFIELAAEIGAGLLTFSLPNLTDFPHPNNSIAISQHYPGEIGAALSRSLHILYAFSEEMTICFINTAGCLTNPIIKRHLSESLKKEEIQLCLDTANLIHSNSCELEFFRDNREHIEIIHLHDATDKADHLPVGHGQLKFETYFNLFEQNKSCPIIFKSKSRSELLTGLEAFRYKFCTKD